MTVVLFALSGMTVARFALFGMTVRGMPELTCLSRAHTKKAHSNEWAFLLIGSLAVFYSHMGKPHTTIDANVFHF